MERNLFNSWFNYSISLIYVLFWNFEENRSKFLLKFDAIIYFDS